MKTRFSILIAIAAALGLQFTANAALPALTNIILAWNPVPQAANYTLYWGTNSHSYAYSNSCVAPQTNLTTANLLANQFYYFAVTATGSSNNQSGYSAEVVYSPAPGNLTISGPPGGGATAGANWAPVTSAAKYTLFWGVQSGSYSFNQACPASQTNLTVSSLIANQTYYFVVTATDANGNQSAYSPEVVYVNTDLAPSAPSGLVVSGPPAGGPIATGNWNPVANVATYQLAWGTISHNYIFKSACSNSQTTLNATGLLTNQVYYFAVSCTGSNGLQSPNSAEVVYSNAVVIASATNAPTVTLASPQDFAALASTNNGVSGIALGWDPVNDAGGYGLYWGTNTESYVWSTNLPSVQTNVTLTNLAAGEIYYFAVMALGGTGTNNSPFSTEVVYTNALPSPTNFTVSSASSGATAAWNPVEDAASYSVFYGTKSGVYGATATCQSPQTNLLLTNLVANGIYYLAVTAISTNDLQSEYSAEVIFTNTVLVSTNTPPEDTIDRSAPKQFVLPPLAVGVVPGAVPNSAVVTWGATNIASSYLLDWGPGTISAPLLSSNVLTSQTGVTVTNLSPNQTYVFLVYAYSNFIPISWGSMVEYTNVYVPPQPPAVPTGFTVSSATVLNSAVANWSPVPNVAGYELYWGSSTGNYAFSNYCSSPQATFAVSGLATNSSYYFAVAAVGTNGLVSALSVEAVYSNAPPPTPSFPPSTNQVPGIPPLVGMSYPNAQPNLIIAGTVGAQMQIQATTNLADPLSWQIVDTVTLTNAATGSNASSVAPLPEIVAAAFAPSVQVYVPSVSNAAAPGQFYRVSMPYDYATLAYQVLPLTNYPTRLIGIIMPGLSQNVCYVTNQYNFIYVDASSFNVDVQSSGPTIREIAMSLSGVLNQNWTSAVELSYSNGVYQSLAMVVQTDPPSSDPVPGQQPPSPIQINF